MGHSFFRILSGLVLLVSGAIILSPVILGSDSYNSCCSRNIGPAKAAPAGATLEDRLMGIQILGSANVAKPSSIEKKFSAEENCVFLSEFVRLKTGVFFKDKDQRGQKSEQAEIEESGEVVVRAKIGSGPDDLGVITPKEANPEGPMSFVVGPGGEIYVLDQINSRIQVFKKGKRTRTIPIPAETFSDLELMPDGRIALMDNLAKEEVCIVSQKGKVEEKIPLKRISIPEPGAITGIYCRSEGPWPGLWAEVENGFVLIADLNGKPNSEMKSLPGLLTFSGKRFLKIEIAGEKKVKVYRSEEDFKTWNSYEISFELPLGVVYGPWEDNSGNIYLAANTFDENNEANEIVILGPGGKERSRIELAPSSGLHEVLKPVCVTSDGAIYQLAIDVENNSVVIRKYNY